MQIVVRVAPEVAQALSSQANTESDQELMQTARELGVSLEPLHPGTSDDALRLYFVAHVADPLAAEQAASRLQSGHGVDAAYVKPPDELP